jgi:ABC-type antimicrobial peptide transport system permease subunit
LIITVTILDVVSRRRDFAIYKVIGFKQNEVSGMVLVEYGLMTLITSIFASGLVYLVTIFMNEYGSDLLDINQKIYFDFTGSVLWNLGLMALVLTLVYFVSKQTLKVKPADMLRYE